MSKRETIEIELPDGGKETVEVLLHIHLDLNGRDYIVYTKNETDDKDMVTTYTAETSINREGNVELSAVEDEEIWAQIKEKIRNTVKENIGGE